MTVSSMPRRMPFLHQRTWIVLRWRELRGYLFDVLSRPNPNARHVLIYAPGRSGTTLLESLLVSTGHFEGLGEPLHLHTREVWAPVRYIRGLGRRAGKRALVVHVKGSQLVRGRRRPTDPRSFLQTLHADGWTIVHVERLGVADQVLSECYALARGAYHKTDDAPDDRRIRIEPEEFLRRYHRLLEGKGLDRRALDNLPHLNFIYETDLMDATRHQATADRICKALGLPPRPVRTDLRRIGGTDPRHRLENYHEIGEALKTRGLNWGGTAQEQLH